AAGRPPAPRPYPRRGAPRADSGPTLRRLPRGGPRGAARVPAGAGPGGGRGAAPAGPRDRLLQLVRGLEGVSGDPPAVQRDVRGGVDARPPGGDAGLVHLGDPPAAVHAGGERGVGDAELGAPLDQVLGGVAVLAFGGLLGEQPVVVRDPPAHG